MITHFKLSTRDIATLCCDGESGVRFADACRGIGSNPSTVRRALKRQKVEAEVLAHFKEGRKVKQEAPEQHGLRGPRHITQEDLGPVVVPNNAPAQWLARSWRAHA